MTKRLFLLSHFNHVATTLPRIEEISWEGFIKKFGKHLELCTKEQAPVISPAEWPSGTRRQKKSVLRVHFAALDLDKISDEMIARVQKILEPYRYFIHTTFSHANTRATSGLNCLRVYLPLSRPVENIEWPTFWNNLNALVGNVLDPSCKDAGRVYFVPSMPRGTRDQNYTKAQEGNVIDVESLVRQVERTGSQQMVTHGDLVTFANTLKRRPEVYPREMGALLLKVANGEVFANPGARDSTLFRICAQLAEKWPKADPEQIASLFKESLIRMQTVSEDAPCIEDVVEKLSRKQEEQPPAPTRTANSADILDAFGGKRDTPYTEEELKAFAEESGSPRSRLNQRWIIRKGELCYIFLDGQYGKPVQLGELVDAAKIDLSPAVTSGVELYRLNHRGQVVAKNERDLLSDYSTLARSIVANLAARKSYYDWTTKTLIEAPCPLRPLEPTYSKNVDQYLRLLGGKSQEQLLDWVALVTKLEKPCAALFLYGASSTGKSLLGMGLSRLWTTGAMTLLKDVIGEYNDVLGGSPLVIADEKIPSAAQKEGGSADLRSMIQEYSRPSRRKYEHHASLMGALRLFITANNKNALTWKESLNNDDVQAIRDRILSIEVGPASAQYLRDLGEERESFVWQDEIAKHALWLGENRKVDSNTRFLVKGNEDAFTDSLVTNTSMGSAVLHWLTCYLQNPFKLDAQCDDLIRIFEGQLLVTARALVENWETYTTNTDKRLAHIHKISSALSNLSIKGDLKKKQLNDSNNHRTNYWRIDTNYLLNWNKENGFATEEEILAALAKDTGARGKR